MEPQSIRIAMHETSDGYEISPERVPLATLRAFARDVDDLIRGDAGEISARGLEVSVTRGSLAIQTRPLANAGLLADLVLLAESEIVDRINAKRRAVIERWQKAAKSMRRVSFEISAAALPTPIVVSRDSDFRLNDADQWVRVERYVLGEVYELGGLQNINAHMRLKDGRTLVVNAKRELLQSDSENRLFKLAMARINAEFNVVTREYRDAQLIAFAEYDREPDEEQLQRLTARGAKAWADVPDAQQWVEAIRGSRA